MVRSRDRLVVLGSVPPPRPTTNPYSIMLIDAIRAESDVEFHDFSWRRALLGTYDVFHAHWPESLMGGRWPMRLVRQVLLFLLVARISLTGRAVVRTQHNVGQPDGLSITERWLLTAFENRTTLFIVLNDHTPLPAGAPRVLIPHGHYRDWYSSYTRSDPEPGRIAFYGGIRRYKGVEQLIEAFRDTSADHPELRLSIAGRPSSDELAHTLEGLVGDDVRVDARFGFVPTDELVSIATSAQLIVLPYRFMHNSGAILAALSLDRPVLVPDNPVARDLASEVGPGWIWLFTDGLTATDLEATMSNLARSTERELPALKARDWDDVGREHVAAFRRAYVIKHPRRRQKAAVA